MSARWHLKWRSLVSSVGHWTATPPCSPASCLVEHVIRVRHQLQRNVCSRSGAAPPHADTLAASCGRRPGERAGGRAGTLSLSLPPFSSLTVTSNGSPPDWSKPGAASELGDDCIPARFSGGAKPRPRSRLPVHFYIRFLRLRSCCHCSGQSILVNVHMGSSVHCN